MMMPIRASNDENVDNALDLTGRGGFGVYKFIKWRGKHKEEAKGRLLEDACSLYRGGSYDPKNEEKLKDLIENLAGGQSEKGQPFVFFGNKSDLSYFWAKDPKGKRPELSAELLAQIPDDKIRRQATATFARCYADGVLDYDFGRQVYTITEAGKKAIAKPDFVQGRLVKEAAFFSKADIVLENDVKSAAEERMRERGFEGCKYVTINRETLVRSETDAGLFTRVPNTGAKWYVEFDKSEVFDLTENTCEAYIDPGKQYTVCNRAGNPLLRISGEELSQKYEIKNRQERAAYRQPQQSPPEPESRFARIAAAERIDGAAYQAGDYVFAVGLEDGIGLSQYRVAYALLDKQSGEVYYKLLPTAADKPELLFSNGCADKLIFSSRSAGAAALSTPVGQAAASEMKRQMAAVALGKSALSAAAKTTPATAAVSAAYQAAERAVRAIQR